MNALVQCFSAASLGTGTDPCQIFTGPETFTTRGISSLKLLGKGDSKGKIVNEKEQQ
jgi:hypothetical protein